MSDVDAILASGVYVDRRGSRWERTDQGGYTQWWSEDEWPCIEHADMRRLIERDLHRAECPGLDACGTHPVVTVAKGSLGGWAAFPPRCDIGRVRLTFAEVIAAAHDMTGDDDE